MAQMNNMDPGVVHMLVVVPGNNCPMVVHMEGAAPEHVETLSAKKQQPIR